MSESDQNKLVAGLRELSIEIEKLHEHESNVIAGSKRGGGSSTAGGVPGLPNTAGGTQGGAGAQDEPGIWGVAN